MGHRGGMMLIQSGLHLPWAPTVRHMTRAIYLHLSTHTKSRVCYFYNSKLNARLFNVKLRVMMLI